MCHINDTKDDLFGQKYSYAKKLKMIEIFAYGYSYESSQ